MLRRGAMCLMLGMLLLLTGCTHHPSVYQVKPPLKPPPLRPQFTSPLQTEESRWILDVVKWGEYHCREVAAMNGLGDPSAFCRVQ